MIKRLRLRDFKSIRELDLEFDPITVLIGRSGTGKSNVVQAIRFLRNLLLNYDEAIAYEYGWERIVPEGEKRPQTSIDVTFSIPGEDLEFSYGLGFGTPPQQPFPSQMQVNYEKLSLGNDLVFSRSRKQNGQWDWEKAPNISPLPGPASGHLMLGSFPSLQQVVFAHAALATGIGYYHFPANALSAETPVNRGNNLYNRLPGLWDNAGNYLSVMRGITQDFHRPTLRKSLLASLSSLNSSISSLELDSLTSPQRAVIGHKARDRIFALSLDQESDGLRRFYAHLLALYQTPAKLALVFEEPENAIFPGALSLLADEFKAAPGEDRGQVILTTHSPILLDSLEVDNVRAVDMFDGRTLVARVAKEQRQAVKDRLLTTGELLTVDSARLEQNIEAIPAK
jgi:predicted ATPase